MAVLQVRVQVRSRDAPQRWPLAATTADDMDTINNTQTAHIHTTPTQTPTTTLNRPTTTPIPSPHIREERVVKEDVGAQKNKQQVQQKAQKPVVETVQVQKNETEPVKAPVSKAPEPVEEWKEVKTRRPRKQTSQYSNGTVLSK